MENNTPVIAINNLTRRYGKLEAVNGLTLPVRPGRCYGFFGRNGAGQDDHHQVPVESTASRTVGMSASLASTRGAAGGGREVEAILRARRRGVSIPG